MSNRRNSVKNAPTAVTPTWRIGNATDINPGNVPCNMLRREFISRFISAANMHLLFLQPYLKYKDLLALIQFVKSYTAPNTHLSDIDVLSI